MSEPEPGGSASLTLRAKLRGLPQPVWVLFVGTFINRFGNFLPVFLVLYLIHRGYTPAAAGLALAVVGIGNAFGNAIGGSVADRLGRRGTITLSMFGSGAFTLLVPFVRGLPAIVGVVAVVGIMAQLYRPASGAILLDTVPDGQRVTAFAVYRLAINSGMALGPLVAGVLSGWSYTYLFVGDAVTSFAYGVLVVLLLRETGVPTRSATDGSPRPGYRNVFSDRAFVLFLLSFMAAMYVYTQSTVTLPFHLHAVGQSNEVYGLLLGFNAVLVILFEIPLTHLVEGHSERFVMASALVILGLGMALTGLADRVAPLFGTVAIWTFAEMLYTPTSSAYPGRYSDPRLRGRYQGMYGLASTAAAAIGASLGALAYGASPTGHWISCAVIGALGGALLLPLGLRRSPANAPTAVAS